MSKALGKAAAKAIAVDLFGNQPSGRFKLLPPDDFALFNSLHLIEVDTFSTAIIARVESVFWDYGGEIVSCITVSPEEVYYSSIATQPPAGARVHAKNEYVIVLSNELSEQDHEVWVSLAARGFTHDKNSEESFFMFLRAKNLLTFREHLRLRAEEEVKHQPLADGYAGTPVADLFPFYDEIAVFKVEPASPLHGRSIYWPSLLIALRWRGARNKCVDDSSMALIEEIVDRGLWHIPIDNIRVAIVASHFKHAFVDVYRCIEWMYALPRTVMVKTELGLDTKATVLVRTLRDKLSWRRTELDSLRLLLQAADPRTLDFSALQACSLDALAPLPASGPEQDTWTADVVEKLANRIYKVRNQMVHQLDAEEAQPVVPDSERFFISVLLKLCVILYEKYASEF